jgi:hypothetical protein
LYISGISFSSTMLSKANASTMSKASFVVMTPHLPMVQRERKGVPDDRKRR